MDAKKTLRRIDYLVKMLYTRSRIGAVEFRPGEHARRDYFSKEIRLSGHRMLQLTDTGLKDFRDLVAEIDSLALFQGDASYSDIWSASKTVYQDLLSNNRMPDDGREFIELVQAQLRPRIATRRFVVPVSGLMLVGLESVQLGSLRLISPSAAALADAGANTSHEHAIRAIESMSHNPWIVGDAVGTERVATDRFRAHAELTVGLLAIFASANYERGATCFRLSLRMTPEASHGRSTFLRWEIDDGEVTVYYNSSSTQHLRLDAVLEQRLRDGGLFDRAFALIAKGDGSQLENAIIRAIYWFSDAQRDATLVMQFVKYWSCVETFFSQDKDVVRSVSSGLATVLVAGGGGFFSVKAYVSLKRRIAKLYALRCRALHGGSYQHVSERDVVDLSQWTAWMVIIMLSLVERGYQTSEQVRAQTVRLDSLMTRAASAKTEDTKSPHIDTDSTTQPD